MKRSIKRLMACTIILALLCCLPPSALGEEVEGASTFPERFDLRDRGVVTPVKNQAPFGTCWAFGAVSSIETSLLSAMGTTYDQTGLDLSEKQLGWFAYTPLPSAETMAGVPALAPYTSQAGEGQKPLMNKENSFGTPYQVGGWSFLVTTLISSGIGPVSEELIPYKNKQNVAVSNQDSPSAELTLEQTVNSLPNDPSYYNLFIRKGAIDSEKIYNTKEATPELIEQNALSNYAAYPAYTSDGYLISPSSAQKGNFMYDWSLPESDRLLSSVELKETYILPTPASMDEQGKYRFNEEGVRAIKEQLTKGRAVCVGFLADDSSPGEESLTNYMNRSTWSHYTYDAENQGDVQHANHVVSIVGWDDNWGVDKFNQGKTEAGASKAPPAAGAWIVKNSWGAEGNGFPNEGTFGFLENGKHSGYFYLSYYDMSLTRAETFEFDVANRLNPEEAATSGKIVSQYDFMPAADASMIYFDGESSFANVFESYESQNVHALSVETARENTHAMLELYRLREDSQNPRDGELLARTNCDFRYGGYHRVDLNTGYFIDKGERFSVVATLTEQDADGSLLHGIPFHQNANKLYTENDTEKYHDSYGIGVVNVGESYLFDGNEWTDWTERIDYMKTNSSTAKYFDYDNFALKAFGDKVEACTVSFDPNGGSGTMGPVRMPVGEKYVLPECSFTPPTGMRFAGWDKGQVGEAITVEGDMTLVATWQPITPQPEPKPEQPEAPQPEPEPEPQQPQTATETRQVTRSNVPNTGDSSASPIALVTLAVACLALATLSTFRHSPHSHR